MKKVSVILIYIILIAALIVSAVFYFDNNDQAKILRSSYSKDLNDRADIAESIRELKRDGTAVYGLYYYSLLDGWEETYDLADRNCQITRSEIDKYETRTLIFGITAIACMVALAAFTIVVIFKNRKTSLDKSIQDLPFAESSLENE